MAVDEICHSFRFVGASAVAYFIAWIVRFQRQKCRHLEQWSEASVVGSAFKKKTDHPMRRVQ